MTALVERHGSTVPGRSLPAPPASRRWSSWPARSSARRWPAACARSAPSRSSRPSSLAEARARALGTSTRDLASSTATCPTAPASRWSRELRGLGWVRGLVLSSTEDPYTVRAALTGGVRAFLVTASSGGPSVRSAAPQTLATRPRASRLTGAEALSGREVEVLQLVADGRSNKEIGEALGPVRPHRQEPPGPDRPQARHRRPRRDGRRRHARRRRRLTAQRLAARRLRRVRRVRAPSRRTVSA